MKHVAIAESRFNEGQYIVLTKAKRNRWEPVSDDSSRAKRFDSKELALKDARRASLTVSPEIITEDEYLKLVGYEANDIDKDYERDMHPFSSEALGQWS